jgi:hypothetical protein
MTTFDIVGRYFLFLLLFGVGLYLVLVEVIPSWRKRGVDSLETYLGHGRSRTVIEEWDLNGRKSARVNAIVGGLLMLGGIAGIIWTSYLK